MNMIPGTQFYIESISKKIMSACVACEVHVHSGVNFNSKWYLFPDVYGKNSFEILHLEMCDGLWGSKSDSVGNIVYTQVTLCLFYCRLNIGLIEKNHKT